MTMREEKKKRLEAKGWKIGTTRDFLDLSPDEEAYIELRLRLADGLKQRRVRRGVTQVDLARAVHSSQSRIARWKLAIPPCRSTCSFARSSPSARQIAIWPRLSWVDPIAR